MNKFDILRGATSERYVARAQADRQFAKRISVPIQSALTDMTLLFGKSPTVGDARFWKPDNYATDYSPQAVIPIMGRRGVFGILGIKTQTGRIEITEVKGNAVVEVYTRNKLGARGLLDKAARVLTFEDEFRNVGSFATRTSSRVEGPEQQSNEVRANMLKLASQPQPMAFAS